MKLIGIITTVLTTLILAPIWRGYVFSKLWLWFIVSTFGASVLSIAQAIGLALVVSFLTHQPDMYEDKSRTQSEKFSSAVCITFMTPAFALLIGWVVTHWL
jgi:hypothetical protein